MLNEESWNEYLNSDDPTIDAALNVFNSNTAFPKLPAAKPAVKGKTSMVKPKVFDNDFYRICTPKA